MKDRKKKKAKSFLEKYNDRETKGNIENTLIKGAVDALAGSVIGTGIGALAGDKAAFAGIALILAGHYFGDESGVMRITGVSTLAYGIGKANEYKNNPNLDSPQKRLSDLKDNWLTAFHIKWKKETQQQEAPSQPVEVKPTSEKRDVTSTPPEQKQDLHVNGNKEPKLDQFETRNEQMASYFEKEKSNEVPDSLKDEDNLDLSLI